MSGDVMAPLTCATACCGKPATRHHTWRKLVQVEVIGPRGGRSKRWAKEGEVIESYYCDDCSFNLWRHDDDEVDPPWELASVTPLGAVHIAAVQA